MFGDIFAHILIKAGEKLLELLSRGVGRFDLWFERKFGRCLSGRINKLEIQHSSTETPKTRIKSKGFAFSKRLDE